MVRKCTEKDRESLMDYLRREAVYNTFLLADIGDFGFDKDFQTVYMDIEDEIRGVYLCFYQNLILYADEVNLAFLGELLKIYVPDVVMGKMENVRQAQKLLPEYSLGVKDLYLLEKPEKLLGQETDIQEGTLSDVDDIFDFLQTIPEIRNLYTSKQMIHDRIAGNTGTHYLIRRDGAVVSHANSTAQSSYTTMIGGVATARGYRGQNLAGSIVSRLCRDILARGKTPCLFCDRGEEHNLYCKIGFTKVGQWGTLVKG